MRYGPKWVWLVVLAAAAIFMYASIMFKVGGG